ncbi:hypothetical protein JDW21_14890 [Bacillus subtilis]|uniref:hypothetical protein n=1 Tax=Bacillus subtilis TaxID=1423 RepID=UPI000F53FD90|nr:hypothetical protein [Bacillus subtilis]QHF60271.1 hypothetical protein Bateq7PJ16_4465 [Bacillus subtilis]RPK03638.1 hypothetical protein EH11_00038 [Bacillus subtilis]RUS09311.1 hypothetical protein EFW59_00038 [Bacillus subtilis]
MNINDEIRTLFSNAVFQNKIENYTGISNLMALKIENQYIYGYSSNKYGLPSEVVSSWDIVYKLVEQIELYKEKYTLIDPSLLDNLFYDLSLSLIFDDYNISNEDHINYKKLISDLKDIGAKSYEGKPVDIGVIFCPDKQSYQQLNQLNIDIISIPSGISIKDFFEKEKPFLRLIDNESFAIIIDGEFNVFAIARKQKSEKSINYIIEKQFSTHVTNKIHNILLDTYLDELTKNVNKNKADDLITLKKEMKRNIDNRPQYIYFYLKNWKINIHSKNDFTLTYFNGDWKLKPYNLINAILANYLFKKNIKTLDIDPLVARQLFNDLMDSIEVLSATLKRLSLCNLSSIYLINYENELLKVINEANKNPSPLYLNVVSIGSSIFGNINTQEADYYVMQAISAIDGAVLLDNNLTISSFGEIVNMTGCPDYQDTFGTGTKAARYASRNCLAIKISEDGDIYFFQNEDLLVKI